MANITKCFVEIFFIHDDFITFDFGNFAIVVVYYSENNTNQFYFYFKDNYRKQFMVDWAPKIGRVVNSIRINFREFKEIKNTCLKLAEVWGEPNCEKLFNLLKRNFEKQIKLYGHWSS